MTGPIVVVGDVATDVVVRAEGAVAADSDTTAQIRHRPGGAGANVAGWLGWLGVPVRFAGRIGDDAAGHAHAAALARLGVEMRLAVDPNRPTGTVVVIVAPGGGRTMFPDRGASAALRPDDVLPALDGAGHLHVSGYVLLHSASRAAGLAAIGAAEDGGVPVSVDPSSAAPLARVGAATFLSWTGAARLCLPNAAEARLLSGREDLEEAAAVLARWYGEVAVTAGEDAAVWSDGDLPVKLSPRARRVVDSTGAGDAFTAGFLSVWASGAPAGEALEAGHRVAGVAVGRVGAGPWTSLGRRAQTSE